MPAQHDEFKYNYLYNMSKLTFNLCSCSCVDKAASECNFALKSDAHHIMSGSGWSSIS